MSTTFISDGDVVTYTAPSGGVTAGVPVLIGGLIVIPRETVAQGLQFDGDAEGIHLLPKTDLQAWTEGQAVYLDNTNHRFDTTATVGFFQAGVAVGAVAGTAGLTTGLVRLNGTVTFPVSATYVAR